MTAPQHPRHSQNPASSGQPDYGQQPYGQQGYPSPGAAEYPTYPGPTTLSPTEPIKPPQTVMGAFGVYVLSALVSALSVVLIWTSDIWDVAAAAGVAEPGNGVAYDAESVVLTAKVIAGIVGVVILALYLLLAFKMRGGRNWARVVLTVLSGYAVLGAVLRPVGNVSRASVTINNQVYEAASSAVLSWVTVVLGAVAIVLMFLPASNAYFAAAKARRS